jgi:hypothetical protein
VKLTEGNYKAKPVQAILGQSSTGKDQVEIVFVFYDRKTLTNIERSGWFYLTPAAFDRTIETLRVCGWTSDDLSDLSSISETTSPDVEVVMGEEEYEGKIKLKLKYVNKWRERQEREPLEPAKAREFAEVMRSKVKEADARNQQKNGAPGKAPF